MPDLDVLPVVVATIVAFVLSGVWYAVLGDQLATVSDAARSGEQPPAWTYGVELLRTLVVATVVAGLVVNTRTDDWAGGLALGLALWVGLPLMLWVGAVLHERAPIKLAAIHAGDWLLKLLVIAVVTSVWS
jgi:Protein of unknown function (DUF1761)